MKNSFYILFTAILSSLVTIALFKLFDNPETIIIRERIPATQFQSQPVSQSVFRQNSQTPPKTTPEPVKSDIFESGLKSLVQIKSGKKQWLGNFYSNQVNQNGSGVIISEDGYIATNFHVINDATDIEVILWNKESYAAKIIGYDRKTDLALLKIDSKPLTFLNFGDSDKVSTGDKIYALGHPFRMDATVTEGIVSGKHRQLGISKKPEMLESFIQTDAVINPGNSGGALINTSGDLIGINTAILTRSGNFEGYSFAIPSNLAHKILSDLQNHGRVHRSKLGIQATYHLIPESSRITDKTSAIRIEKIEPNTPAHWHRLQLFDYIYSINGQNLESVHHLKEVLWSLDPGQTVPLVYQRKKILDTILVTLMEENDNTEYPLLLKFGISVRLLEADELHKYPEPGILVESLFKDSMAETLNLKPGFVITRINDHPVTTVKEFLQLFESSGSSITLSGHYPDNPQTYYYSFNISQLS